MAKRRKQSVGFERVKWTPRVAPADVATFQAVRAVMSEQRGGRVSDAEVFRLAVVALVASLPEAVRRQVERAARG